MYAVIKTGGKQQKVKAGDVIEVEYMDVDPGSAVEFEPILVVDDKGKAHVGRKSLASAKVVATLLGDKKADKIKVFKYRPKSGYKRTQGHRQLMTVLEVQEVQLSARKGQKTDEDGETKAVAKKKTAAKKPAAKKKTSAKKKTGAKKTSSKKSSSKAGAE